MAIYLVTYDLHKPERKYKALIDQLQGSQAWWHFLESTWLIQTSEDINTLSNRLITNLDTNDFLLMIEVKRNYQGWLPKEAWDWMNERISVY
jgi:hypothetical protein